MEGAVCYDGEASPLELEALAVSRHPVREQRIAKAGAHSRSPFHSVQARGMVSPGSMDLI